MRVSGLASNLDWETMVEKLMEIERRPLLLLERRKLEIEAEKNAWSDIRSRLGNLQDRIDDVLASDLFQRATAASSDESVLTATTGTGAQPGTYTVTVTRLAQAHSIGARTAVTDATADLGYSGTFRITVGTATYDVTVAATDSLNEIRDKINQVIQDAIAADPQLEPYGARAEVIGGYLVITRTEEGTGTIEITDLYGGTVAQDLGLIDAGGAERVLVTGQDAEFTVNGLTFTRSSNTVTDVIQGVTLELQKADPAKTVELTVAPDDDAVVEAVKKFIEQYNSALSFMNQQLDYKAAGGGKLGGDTLLIGLRQELRRLVSDPVAALAGTTAYDRLSAIGITTSDETGTLQLDEAKLREALAADRAAVQRLLAGDPDAASGADDGVFARLDKRVEAWLQAGTGLLDTRIDSLGDRAEDYADQIERMEYRLQLREQNLLRQFQALESLISTLRSQENWLVQQIGQLSSLRPRD